MDQEEKPMRPLQRVLRYAGAAGTRYRETRREERPPFTRGLRDFAARQVQRESNWVYISVVGISPPLLQLLQGRSTASRSHMRHTPGEETGWQSARGILGSRGWRNALSARRGARRSCCSWRRRLDIGLFSCWELARSGGGPSRQCGEPHVRGTAGAVDSSPSSPLLCGRRLPQRLVEPVRWIHHSACAVKAESRIGLPRAHDGTVPGTAVLCLSRGIHHHDHLSSKP